MNSWPIKPLAEVCEINPRLSRNHNLPDDQRVSFVPMAAVDEVSGTIASGQSRPFGEVKKGYTYFQNGDVLFAKITPCMENGKAAMANNLVNGHGFGSTEFHVLRPGPDIIGEWIFYFVRQRCFRQLAKQNFTGTAGQQRVPTTFLSSASIPVPPLAEQRRLVDLLNRAEGVIQLRREAEKKAAELVPALFISMFGEPATNPKGWPKARLGEVIDSADYGSSAKASTEGPGLPIIRMGNVDYAGNLDTSDLKYVEVASDTLEKYRLHAGDILFNRTNSKDLVGKTGVWDGRCEAIAASYFIRVRVNRSSLNPFYLWSFMNTAYMKRVLRETARGAIGQSNINAKELRGFLIPIPPISLQDAFEQRRQEIVAIEAQQGSATAKALATFEVLLHQIFSGGLDGNATLLRP